VYCKIAQNKTNAQIQVDQSEPQIGATILARSFRQPPMRLILLRAVIGIAAVLMESIQEERSCTDDVKYELLRLVVADTCKLITLGVAVNTPTIPFDTIAWDFIIALSEVPSEGSL
jgi:hypothetical protein